MKSNIALPITNLRMCAAKLTRYILFPALFFTFGCGSPSAPPAGQVKAATNTAAHPLENGAYAVLREASTPEEARGDGVPQVVIAYDRRKYSGAPPNLPLTYVTINPTDYVPSLSKGRRR